MPRQIDHVHGRAPRVAARGPSAAACAPAIRCCGRRRWTWSGSTRSCIMRACSVRIDASNCQAASGTCAERNKCAWACATCGRSTGPNRRICRPNRVRGSPSTRDCRCGSPRGGSGDRDSRSGWRWPVRRHRAHRCCWPARFDAEPHPPDFEGLGLQVVRVLGHDGPIPPWVVNASIYICSRSVRPALFLAANSANSLARDGRSSLAIETPQ